MAEDIDFEHGADKFVGNQKAIDRESGKKAGQGIVTKTALGAAATGAALTAVGGTDNAVDLGKEALDHTSSFTQKVEDALSPDVPFEEHDTRQIIRGSVNVELNSELKIRKAPHVSLNNEPGNVVDLKDIRFANPIIGPDGRLTYEPLEAVSGKTIMIENPEVAFGQDVSGGAGYDESGKWLKIRVMDEKDNIHYVYTAIQPETFEFVRLNEGSEFINLEKKQDAQGLKLVIGDKPLPAPENTGKITYSAE